jgi:hypothetical protein
VVDFLDHAQTSTFNPTRSVYPMSILRKPEEPKVEGDEIVISRPEEQPEPPTEERKKLPKTKWF